MASLINGTVPDKPEGPVGRGTETVVVALNVAEVVEDLHQGTGLEDALAAVEQKYPVVVAGGAEDSRLHDALDAEYAATRARYTDSYARYAEQFDRAVQDQAATMAGLTVAVVVEADADPSSRWWTGEARHNPVQDEADPLVWQLWSHAHQTVPLPLIGGQGDLDP